MTTQITIQATASVYSGGPQGPYIYRRLAVVSGARAFVQPMAVCWAVVIRGWIGRNTIKVMEEYNTRPEARQRMGEVNKDCIAIVESIEEVLYPRAYIEARIDLRINGHHHLPPAKSKSRGAKPFTNMQDLYDMYHRVPLTE